MSEQTAQALRAWFKRAEPLYPELFNTAYAICGSYALAESALRGALVDAWADRAEGGMGFKEKLRGAVREEALRLLKEDGGSVEIDWPGFDADLSDDPAIRQAAREDAETQRALMLRHGVGLSPGRISVITGMSVGMIRSALNRYLSRVRRALPGGQRGRAEAHIHRAMTLQLAARQGVPPPAAVYRAFEAEASGLQPPAHRLSQVIYRVLVLVMALVCAALFWLFAVLVQPPAMQGQGQAVTVQAPEQ